MERGQKETGKKKEKLIKERKGNKNCLKGE